MEKWTEQEIAFIMQKKETTDLTWVEITKKYNKKFNTNKNFECVKKCYQRYKNIFKQSDYEIKLLKDIHRTKKNNSYRAKENRTVLQHWVDRDDLIEQFKDLVKNISVTKYKPPKSLIFNKGRGKKNANKDRMTMELLFGDSHFGKLVKNDLGDVVVDRKVIIARIKKLCSQIIKEIERNSVFFNIERMVIGMLGDLIESSHMHGEESLKGCEFGTARQMNEAIMCIFKYLIVPLSQTGLPVIDVVCVTGNHDRLDKKQTYVKPGENNLSFYVS